MKVLLAGDTHGNYTHMRNVFAHASRNDCEIIIQLGDFGYGWKFTQFKGTDGLVEDWFTHKCADLVKETDIPLWWLPGNHDNYTDLYSRVDYQSAQRAEMASGVSYLPRGHTFDLDGIRFLCCGGAASVDKKYRTPGVSWWSEEMIFSGDVVKCRDAGPADVLLVHDFPWEVSVVDRHLSPVWGYEAQLATESNRKQVSEILSNCGADRVFHGHLHLFYSEVIHVLGKPVHVTGLNCDGASMRESTYIFDTEKFNHGNEDIDVWNQPRKEEQ